MSGSNPPFSTRTLCLLGAAMVMLVLLFVTSWARAALISTDTATPHQFSGSVGINTASPAATLDVNGGVRAGSATAVTACTAASEGTQRYNFTKHAIEWCNGSGWMTASAVSNSNPAPVGMGGVGYFVLTAGSYNGNLGGLAGANAICRTELVNNAWMGKPGTIDTSKVFAFLCDSVSCNAPIASTTYTYATAGDPTAGGAYFTNDSGASGPNDNYQWNVANRFNTGGLFWSNHNTYFANFRNFPGDSTRANVCADYTSNANVASNNGGTLTATDQSRFAGAGLNCSVSFRLVCFLNP